MRDEVRAFLAENCPDPAEVPHGLDERIAYLRRWQARCYEAGYVGRAWPAEFGGGGRPTVEQIVVDQEMAAAVASDARSDPASGSENPWHQITSPRAIGRRKRSCCSGVPNRMINGPM